MSSSTTETSSTAAVSTRPPAPDQTATRRGITLQKFGRDYGIFFALVVVVIAATVVYPRFLHWDNLSAVLAQNAPLGIIAIGMTFVIISGGFDLSVGSVFAAAGTTAAMVAVATGSVALSFIAALAVGLLCGLVNAVVITILRVNPFVATLGSMTFFSGLILLITHNSPVTVSDSAFQWLGTGWLGPVPVSVVVMIALFALGWIVISKSAYGRRVMSVGGAKEASRLAGIRVDLVKGSTYVICGVLAAVAGFIAASQLGVGQGNAGVGLELQAIAVVVIGGTSLLGGEGSMLRTALGLAILATLNNIFFSLAVDTNWQGITQGLILVAAIAFDQYLRKVAPK